MKEKNGLNPAVFWIGCLGTRLTVALVVLYATSVLLNKFLIAFSLGIGISIIVIWMFGLRKKGFEAGGVIWWNALRPIHGAIWLLAAWFIYKSENSVAAFLIVLDVVLAIFARVWWKPRVLAKTI